MDDSRLPVDHPKPVIPPGVKQIYHKPQHLDTAARAATKAPTPAPTAPKAAVSSHLNKAAASGRKLMGGPQLLEAPGQVDISARYTCTLVLCATD